MVSRDPDHQSWLWKAQEIRQWSQFHENPRILSGWGKLLGPLLEWATPARRRTLLALGGLGMALNYVLKSTAEAGSWKALEKGLPHFATAFLLVVVLFIFFRICHLLASNYQILPGSVRRSPQLFLHGLFWALLLAIWMSSPGDGIPGSLLVGLAMLLPFFLWRLGYMFLSGQRGKVKGTEFKDHVMYLWPLYGGSNTPYGKGLDYLSRTEAQDPEALARSQLAGLRLLMLAGIWMVVKELLAGAVFGAENGFRQVLGGASLDLPRLSMILRDPDGGWGGLGWATLYGELFLNVLNRAAKGHLIIGVLRLFGFYVFRNTYKPLLAESVVGFWNRYYYYFKELLVEFFFYPTFARWFRKKARLRLFAAVFMAAFVGNMYYHLIRMTEELVARDFETVWSVLSLRAVYCLLLSMGIFVSMLREQKRLRQERSRSLFRRAVAIFGVWSFFALINIWNQKGAGTLESTAKFLLGLVGLG